MAGDVLQELNLATLNSQAQFFFQSEIQAPYKNTFPAFLGAREDIP